MQDVGERVGLLLRRERTPRPVVLLVGLRERDAQLVARDGDEAELAAPEQARGDHGVEERGEAEAEVALERRDVVIGPVQDLDEQGIRHGGTERPQVHRQAVDQEGLAAVGRDLHEADLVPVVVEAVRLGVEPDRAAARERLHQPFELGGAPDPGHGRGV